MNTMCSCIFEPISLNHAVKNSDTVYYSFKMRTFNDFSSKSLKKVSFPLKILL